MKTGSSLSVLHASVMGRLSRGKCEQLTEEVRAAHALDVQWETKVFVPVSCAADAPSTLLEPASGVEVSENLGWFGRVYAYVRLRQNFFRWLKEVQDQYDLVLLRYSVHDPFQYWFLRTARRPVLLIHHSLEESELKVGGAIGRVRAILESFLGKRALRYSSGVVGVTPEILNYELGRTRGVNPPGFVYPNGGIDRAQPVSDNRASIPTFLFISSSFAPWHGLDLLMAAAKTSNADFTVHVVGEVDGPELWAGAEGVDARFVFHGSLTREGIRRLASESWLGLASFGLYRKNMTQACAMKVRDYLAMGLPVYSSSLDVLPDSFPYYVKGPTELESIVQVAAAFRQVSRTEVAREAEPVISKRQMLRTLYEQLQGTYGQ